MSVRNESSSTSKTRKNKMKGVRVKRKKLHKEKLKMVTQLKEFHEILGSVRPKDEREIELERLVFGGKFADEDIVIDTEPESEIRKENESIDSTKAPAWEDEDDDTILVKDKAVHLANCHRSVSIRGKEKYKDFAEEKFAKLMGNPTWAELGRKHDNESDSESEELLRKTGNLRKDSEHLPKGDVSFTQCPNLALEYGGQSNIIKAVEFNPVAKVALVAGTNETVNLFQIDGKINAKIQSIHFERFPVHSAHFSVDGSEIIVGSNLYSHFFSYDMLAGKISRIPSQKEMNQRNISRFQVSPDGKYMVINGRYGNIHIMTTKSKEWIGSLKMNGDVVAVTFNKDGTRLYSHGVGGEVYIWDMSTRRCIHKFVDEGCITGTSLAISPNDQVLATGSDSGIVNIYDCKAANLSSSPQPLKVFKNLTTEVSHMKFNHSSEILAFSSSLKAFSVKMVHFPSMTTFSNFPSRQHFRSKKIINSLDISLNSGFLCLGTNVGSALVFRLKHFNNY